jgi:hypothetical protein
VLLVNRVPYAWPIMILVDSGLRGIGRGVSWIARPTATELGFGECQGSCRNLCDDGGQGTLAGCIGNISRVVTIGAENGEF